MTEFLYDASIFASVAVAIAIAWQAFRGDGSPPSDHTSDLLAPYDDDIVWGDYDGDANDD